MTTRRNLLLTAAAVAATGAAMKPQLTRAVEASADFLFVQTANGMTFDKAASKLTLEDVGATTLFFSVVLKDPELSGRNLTYTVKLVDGQMPEKGAEVSVFIDIIGMPLTPLSYAGVARRSFRRAFIY